MAAGRAGGGAPAAEAAAGGAPGRVTAGRRLTKGKFMLPLPSAAVEGLGAG